MRFVLFILLLIPISTLSQTIDQTSWQRLASRKGDLILSMPTGFLVNTDNDKSQIIYRKGQVTLTFTEEKRVDPKRRLADIRQSRLPNDRAAYSGIVLGSFSGDVVIKSETKYSFSLDLASAKGFYKIHAVAENPDDPFLAPFLNSIMLDGQHLMKGKAEAVSSVSLTNIDQLKTSQEIKQALEAPNGKHIGVSHELNRAGDNPGFDDADKYSLAAILLRRPRPHFTHEARQENTSGTVKLKVLLGAEGIVRSVIVLSPLPNGLTNAAIEAAKSIKFLPAESGGKPVDSFLTVEYTFTIY